jgi:hypothetical protein
MMRRGFAAVVVVGAAFVVGGALVAPVADAQTGSKAFVFTGADEPFVVPPRVCRVVIDAFGGDGGRGYQGPVTGGGHARATVVVHAGQALTVKVGDVGASGKVPDLGAGGASGSDPSGGDGGAGGTSGLFSGGGGGGGGGSSAVLRAGVVLVGAGGGGGGGAARIIAGATGVDLTGTNPASDGRGSVSIAWTVGAGCDDRDEDATTTTTTPPATPVAIVAEARFTG